MIHFDFMIDDEDAELLFDCVQQEINKLKAACLNMSSEELGKLDDRVKFAIEQHIARLERIKEKMHNKKVGS